MTIHSGVKRFFLPLALPVVLLAASCGGDDDSSSDTTAAATDAAEATESTSGGGVTTAAAADDGERAKLSMWFWGAPPAHQETMQKVLVDAFNASQTEYELSVEFRNTVDNDISVALAAGEGPDIVYGSGPAFVAPYAAAGKLVSMDPYSEQYGWKDRILAPIYESGTVGGELYALPNSLNTLGIFYNKKVLEQYGWAVPTTIEELESIMDQAMAEGLYASVTGNKGWRPVNENYSSIFLTHMAGPETVHKALTGEIPWTSPEIEAAVTKSAEWFQKGYLAGEDYVNLNFSESVQLLADGRSPFFIGPTLVFQFATDFFNEEAGNVDDLGFIPFPTIGEGLPSPLYTLGTTASLSINAASEHPDGAGAVIDFMMSEEFLENMTATWPGYWGVPLKQITADPNDFTGLSKEYLIAIADMTEAVNAGHFGYFSATFFPPATQQEFINIDTVWEDTQSAADFLGTVESTFEDELSKDLVPPIPAPVPA